MKISLSTLLRGFSLLLFLLCLNTVFAKHSSYSSFENTVTKKLSSNDTAVAVPFIVTNLTTINSSLPATGTGCTIIDTQPQSTTVCANETATFMIQVGSDYPDPVAYQWEFSTDDANFTPLSDNNIYSNTQTNALQINNVTNLDGYYYRVIATGAGCDGNQSMTAQLSVNPVPTGNADLQEVCSGESLTLNFQDFISNNVSSSFAWEVTQVSNGITGLNANQTGTGNINTTLQNNSNTAGSVMLSVTPTANNTNCEGEAFDVEVKVYPIALPAITGDDKACAASISQYAIDDVGTAYNWSVSGGGGISGSNTGAGIAIDWNSTASGNYTISVEVTLAGDCVNTQTFVVNLAQTPQVSASATDITCFGENDGTATVLTNGNTPPATTQISWSNQATTASIDNLSAGNYTVNITTEHGCTASSPTMVKEPAALNLIIDKTDVNCFDATDGTATANVSGGTIVNDYQYSWSNNATSDNIENLAPGNYGLTIQDDNSCSASKNITITQPTAISITGSITNATCPDSNDGAIDANVGGGTPSYTYQWKDAAGMIVGQQALLSGIGGGTYTLMITDDNNCTATKDFIVGEEDTTPPTFDCQVANSYAINSNSTVTITAASIVSNAQDNCGIESIAFANQQTSLTFDCAQLGQHTVNLVVTDVNGNSANCTKTINIIDNTAPIVDCPTGVLPLELDGDGMLTVTISDLGITANDNCGVASITFNNQQTSLNFDCADGGEQSLAVVIEDVNGNTTTCNRMINIIDNTRPSINCANGLLQLQLNANTGTASVSISTIGVSADDNCGVSSLTFSNGATQRTFDCDDAGEIYGLTIVARDDAGNVSTCIRQVIILDLIPPVLQCDAAPIRVPLDEQEVVTLNVVDLATATDNCSTPTLSFTNGSISRNLRCDNIEGVKDITIVATDDAGNQSSCVRELDIIDREAPTIDCNENSLYIASLGDTGSRTINAVDLISAVADDCAISSIEFTDGTTSKTFDCNSITPQNGGFYALTVVVRDNGVKIASCTRLVLVLDTNGACN